MLLDRGQLKRSGAEWRLADGGLPLPESVQGIIASRLDGLEPEDKALLQDARRARPRRSGLRRLRQSRGDLEEAIERRLHALERKEFVERVRAADGSERERVRLPAPASRATSHTGRSHARAGRRSTRHAAAWLESLGRPDDHAETVAHHYLSALEFARAADQEHCSVRGRGTVRAPLRRRARARAPRPGHCCTVLRGRARARTPVRPRTP